MARSDFFRNMPIELATELEALSRLQFELREYCKTILTTHDASSVDELCEAVTAGRLPPEAGVDAVRAAVLRCEHDAVHAELAAAIKGEQTASVSIHEQISRIIDEHHADQYPGGSARRLDALELLAVDGTARILRIASVDCWEMEWGEDDSSAQCLLRLPSDSVLRHRATDGTWQTEPLDAIPQSDIDSLLGALLARH